MTETPKKTTERYQYSKCGRGYKEKEWAEKCKAWCTEQRSCNREIISYAISTVETDHISHLILPASNGNH